MWGAKQEQDLFLRFWGKKSLDSLEKAFIVPISKLCFFTLVEFLALRKQFRVRNHLSAVIGSTALILVGRMSRLNFLS
ncbi:hypothetical protein DEB41_09155 [Vibrio anguillarum]|uniref:Uncharacterized protein n=2 Tax=Vibrio TaxID=662 RepID=A0A191W2Z7_VIBAN|nr:hypothetical protein [Vibrio anguillarum]AEH33556.1 hypothetical protein VAA_02299 [Vibrio anguillarum 775]AGU58922.1 hypothetical protein N175_09990 [Vibrio anguillarum M3]MDF9387695.1 hypothetical protein [Vibrio sp. 1151_11]MDQ2189727.1 hypothetical protein [Vibrio sp. A14(2019)]MDQ2195325.1 hypothetical protein [Vibrio sp. 2017_1457_11]NAX18912.1 hypothetical protein [Vibrio sp. V22_P2S10T140]NAX43974.1 hypothetical protein [Vibrio sp. V25_P4S6T154]NNN47150.1 hypothetical protein [Vi